MYLLKHAASLWLLLTPALRPSLSFCVASTTPRALSVTPSINWYGDDGTWSAVSIRVGTPAQWLDILPNTRSSETWVVGVDGCEGHNSLCTSSRGGVFDTTKSSTWDALGFYELGVNEELGNTGYADYGLDFITYGSTGITSPSSILGVVNDTASTWLGSFGLGIVPGSFNNKSPLSAISSLVEVGGDIESHSYGFTAGARYQQKGVPASLTLGGYDANRFVPNHDIKFTLNPDQQPQSFINAVSVMSSASSINDWKLPAQLLSSADRVSAIIDSSTSYLWFPLNVCERFASSLNLSYDASLNLYTFDTNRPQLDILRNADLTFTFTLSDLSTSKETVNITLGYEAFDLQLTFPAIPNTTYGSENSTKYYFPLRQAENEAQYRIGRAFLQEAYLITDYDRNTFSIYQAVHTSNPIGNISIVAIPRDKSTNLSGPPTQNMNESLSTGIIVGIVIGVVVGLAILILAINIFIRRRRTRDSVQSEHEKVDGARSPSLLGRIFRCGGTRSAHSDRRDTPTATEVGADATHARFELPAPLGPAELDSESGTLDGSTEQGSTQDSGNLPAYERARRKLERQQASAMMRGPATGEKTENDVSQVAHYRAPEYIDSPLVSPLGMESVGSISNGQPSPLTPSFQAHESNSPPMYRRINPANVVYAGRLPDNVKLPSHVPKVVDRGGRTIRSETSELGGSDPDADPSSLGSNFTTEEGLVTGDLYGNSSTQSAVSPVSNETDNGSGRIVVREGITAREPRTDAIGSQRGLVGEDLIHVPQPAVNRFSFEEERISGKENSL